MAGRSSLACNGNHPNLPYRGGAKDEPIIVNDEESA